MWQVWIILAGIFVIFEMIIPTDFLIFWVGMGALVTSVTSVFIDNITAQIAIFCISSILLIFCTKPFVRKFMKNSANISTNAYSIIGKTGIVVSEIDPISGKGQIKIGNEIWSAKTNNQEKLLKGTIIKVNSIDGVKAVVSTIEESKIK
ncbi:MAG: NfeD family protein [Clostridia bacterium]|nr:NfeD family protein [Clostridia bacterium]